MNQINSIKRTFEIINKNKRVFLALLMLKAIFLSLILAVNLGFISNTIESFDTVFSIVSAPLEDQDAVMAGLYDNPMKLYDSLGNIMLNIRNVGMFSLIVFVLIDGIIFYIASMLIYDKTFRFSVKDNKFWGYMAKFFFSSAILLLLFYIFFTSAFSSLFYLYGKFNGVHFIISIALFFYIWIVLALLYKNKFDEVFMKSFRIGYKNFFEISLSYLIIFLVFLTSFLFLAISVVFEFNLFVTLISGSLFVAVLIWSKIFFIESVKQIS